LASVYDVGKKIRDTVKMETASIEKLSSDLAEIATHLGKSGDKTKGLSKHLDDASRFHSQRRDIIAEADKKVSELDQQIKAYQANLAKLKLKDEPKAIKKNEKALKELIKTKNETVKEIQRCMKLDEQMNKVFQEARKLIGDLKKIDPLGPRSMADSLKRFTDKAQIKNLAGQLGAIGRGAKAIGI
jgi:chromosome segregation ATPase